MTLPHLDPSKRHDFLLLFDVVDGNPNGDPDAGNLPRVDPETMHGLVSDVAIKRKVRDYVVRARSGKPGYEIYVQHKGVLNTQHQRAYDAAKLKSTGSKQKREDVDKARSWMCQNFYDVRMFGAVMTTGVNAGQVRGPMQMTFARSVHPIVPLDVSITRVAVTKEEDAVQTEEGKTSGKESEMGRKSIVPYGLYRSQGFYNPSFAKESGTTADDLALFWEALTRTWDQDRSSARGLMTCRGVHVFTHDDPLGNAPAQRLFEKVSVTSRDRAQKAPRAFADFEVAVEKTLPTGVTYTFLDWA